MLLNKGQKTVRNNYAFSAHWDQQDGLSLLCEKRRALRNTAYRRKLIIRLVGDPINRLRRFPVVVRERGVAQSSFRSIFLLTLRLGMHKNRGGFGLHRGNAKVAR